MTTYTPKVAVSQILKTKEGASNARTAENAARPTRDEYRKTKELDEARKAGTVPAVTDVETGRDINPHIPQFITDSPWYAIGGVSKGPTLKHQRPHPERVEKAKLSEITEWYKRGTTGAVATKYRKGACANCGAMTHKAKDCFERPRKIGAKFTGEDIAPDEQIQPQLKLWYDAKRDRWNGYNNEEHAKTIAEYQALEEARRMMKAEQQLEEQKTREDTQEEKSEEVETTQEGDGNGEQQKAQTTNEEDDEQAKDEDKYAEDADMPGVHVDNDSRTRITVRNLRIREDTAKYLYNLDPESAYYDPKSRSMRENPFAGTNKEMEEVKFKGENFVRFTGEVTDVNKAQLFAWEAKRKGIEAHQLAEPTKLEQLKRELTVGKSSLKDQQKKAVIEKYGGEEHLKVPPKELLLAQTEAYVEYSRKGKVVKGVEKPVIRSKYPEDVLHNNHTAIWGSFWTDAQWGYSCCHSCVRNSYCTGEAGKTQTVLTGKQKEKDTTDDVEVIEDVKESTSTTEAPKAASSSSSSSDSSDSDSSSSLTDDSEDERTKKQLEEERQKADQRRATKRNRRLRQKETRKQRGKHEKKDKSSGSDSSDDETPVLKKTKTEQTKLAEAMKRMKEAEREAEEQLRLGDRHRKYNVQYDYSAPTDHDMEAYKLTRQMANDPMAAYFEEKKKSSR